MIKKNIKYIGISCIAGFLFTVIIYNFNIVLNLLGFLNEKRIILYTGISLFYFFLYRFLNSQLKLKSWLVYIITILTPILIDASVLITNTDKIPVRFPFASIFPILGAGLGIIYTTRKIIYFRVSLFIVAIFLFATFRFILPKLLLYSLEKNSQSISNTVFDKNFYSINNEIVNLKDTTKSNCVIVECFFKGCLPCEQKKDILKKIRLQYSTKQLSLIFICDGTITPYEIFLNYTKENNSRGITFLYDRDSVLKKLFKIKKYPFEIFASSGKILNTYTGFDDILKKEYYNQQINKINTAINE